jgi:hypothetical protein
MPCQSGGPSAIYSAGRYVSLDMDFIEESLAPGSTRAVLAEIGWVERNRYSSMLTDYFLSSRRPLSSGTSRSRISGSRVFHRVLRLYHRPIGVNKDRLAAFYHWRTSNRWSRRCWSRAPMTWICRGSAVPEGEVIAAIQKFLSA